MILTRETIKEKLSGPTPLIENFDERSLEDASYDMRLGAEFARGGKKARLSDHDPTLLINPGEFVLLTTLEAINMPKNMIGHNGIMSPWAKRGIVSLFSPQIDPGFSGVLVVPVFNAGDAPVSISLKEKIFTVEFAFADKAVSIGWSERHGRQDGITGVMMPVASRPNLLDIGALEESNGLLRTNLTALEREQTQLKASHQVLEAKLDVLEANYRTRLTRRGLAISNIGLLIAIAMLLIALARLGFLQPSPDAPPPSVPSAPKPPEKSP